MIQKSLSVEVRYLAETGLLGDHRIANLSRQGMVDDYFSQFVGVARGSILFLILRICLFMDKNPFMAI